MKTDPNFTKLDEYCTKVKEKYVAETKAKFISKGYSFIERTLSSEESDNLILFDCATKSVISACITIRNNDPHKLFPELQVRTVAKAASLPVRIKHNNYSTYELQAFAHHTVIYNCLLGLTKDGVKRSEINKSPHGDNWRELHAMLSKSEGTDSELMFETATYLLFNINALYAKETAWLDKIVKNGGNQPPTLDSLETRVSGLETKIEKKEHSQDEKISRLRAVILKDNKADKDIADYYLRTVAYEYLREEFKKSPRGRLETIKRLLKLNPNGKLKLYKLTGKHEPMTPEAIERDFRDWLKDTGVWKKMPRESRNEQYAEVRKRLSRGS